MSTATYWDLGVLAGILGGSWFVIKYEHLVFRFLRWIFRMDVR